MWNKIFRGLPVAGTMQKLGYFCYSLYFSYFFDVFKGAQSRYFESFSVRHKINIQLKETWKQWFTKIEKH